MGPEQWAAVEELLAAGLALQTCERPAFVAGISDPAIRMQVASLLTAAAFPDARFGVVIGQAAELLPPLPVTIHFPARFEVLRQIGEGGMGMVFEAVDKQRNLRVALKSLSNLSPLSLYSFKQEFRALAGLVHPNLVTLYELIREGEEYFLSMEFIEGIGFLEYVSKPSSDSRLIYDPERLRAALLQIATGLSAIHAAGKLHRDLKPSNLMVSHEGRAIILDFGLIVDIDPERFGMRTDPVMGGTTAYMSPEQAKGVLSPAADWYSLGLVLFEALTGRSPPKTGSFELDEGPHDDLARLCKSLLEHDPTRRPSGPEVLRTLGGVTAEWTPATLHKPVSLFVDRTEELRQLTCAFSALSLSRPCVVMLSGAAGTGKTTLAERFLETASHQPETVVLSGKCYEQETAPYKGMDSLIDQLSRLLSGPLPFRDGSLLPHDAASLLSVFRVFQSVPLFARIQITPNIADRVELRRRAFFALREMFKAIGNQSRLILWLDDFQWGDRDSVELISEIFRFPDPPRLLLLCSYRSDRSGTAHSAVDLLLDALDRELIEKTVIVLRPLPTEAAALLAQALLAQHAPGGGDVDLRQRALVIARNSEGMPFLVKELVRAQPAVDGEILSVEFMVWSRVSELVGETRRLLCLVAIAGYPITQTAAFAAAGIPSRNPAILNALENAGLLCADGPDPSDTVEPYHDRIREAIMARMDGEEKQSLHLRLAEALESDSSTDAEILAVHFEAGGHPGRAAAYYQQAADGAVDALAFNRAADLYRRILALHEMSRSQRAGVELKLATTLANSGLSSDASRYYLSAAEQLPEAERLRVEGLAAYHLCVAGELGEGRRKIKQSLARIGLRLPRPGMQTIISILWRDFRCRRRGMRQNPTGAADLDPILLARIDLLWFAAAGLGTSDLLGGFNLLLLSMELSQSAREPKRMVRAYAWYAALQFGRRLDSSSTDEAFQHCRALSRSIGDPPESRATLALTAAIRHYFLGLWSEALTACVEAERTLLEECRGMNWELAFARTLILTLLMYRGEVARLQDLAREMLADAVKRGDLATATTMASLPLPYSQIVSGEPALARNTWRYWRDRWPHRLNSSQESAGILIEAWSHLYDGNPKTAFEVFQKGWKGSIVGSGNLRIPVAAVHFRETQARLLVQVAYEARGEKRRKLIRQVKQIIVILRKYPCIHAPAHAAQIEALILAAEGHQEDAVRSMALALTIFEKCEMRTHASATRRVLGQWIGGQRGTELIAEADQAMRAERIKDPVAVTRMHIGEGGFSRRA